VSSSAIQVITSLGLAAYRAMMGASSVLTLQNARSANRVESSSMDYALAQLVAFSMERCASLA
jgi:hypothetical protein